MVKKSTTIEGYQASREPTGSRQSQHKRRAEQLRELTRNQVLHYVAELSEEMSALASQVECAVLADRLLTASVEAREQLPKGFDG